MRPDLVRVKNVYEAAGQRGEPPTGAVAKAFGVNNRTASRYVRAARDSGDLPSTEPGRVTLPTHAPTTAVIFPRSPTRRREWTVCRTCLVPWKCPSWRESS